MMTGPERPGGPLPLSFRQITVSDLDLLQQWLERPHVAAWWPPPASRSELEGEFFPLTRPDGSEKGYLAWLGDRPIGYIQRYNAMLAGDGWWVEETDPGVHGIDQFLAHPEDLGKGLGTAMIAAFVDQLFQDPSVTRIQVDPRPDNARAIRCYSKVGFQPLGPIHTPDGEALLMSLARAEWIQGGHVRSC